MGVVLVPPIVQLVKLWLIGFVFICQGSAGYNISPSPAILSDIPPIEGIPGPVYQQKPSTSYAPSLEPQPNGSNLHPPPALPPLTSAPLPNTTTGLVPSYSPATPMVKPPHNAAPSPVIFQRNAPSLSPRIPNVSSPPNVASPPFIGEGHVPSLPTDAPQRVPVAKSPTPEPSVPDAPHNGPILPGAPESLAPGVHQPNASFNRAPVTTQIGPVAPSPRKSEGNQPPESLAPSVHQQNASSNGAPVREQFSPVASPPRKSEGNQPPESLAPSGHQQNASSNGAPVSTRFGPVASPPKKSEGNQPPVDPITPASVPSVTVPDISHASSPSPSIDWKNDGAPVTAPPDETPKSLSPANNSRPKGSFSAAAPSTDKNMRHSAAAPAPFPSSPQGHQSPASLPSFPFVKHNHTRKKTNGPAPASPHTISPRPKQQGPAIPPFLPESQAHGAPPSHSSGPAASRLRHEFSKPATDASPAPSPSEASGWTKMPLLPHKVPHASPTRSPKIPVLPPIHTLPPPPPNEDCSAFICTEPYANTPPGSPCGCVLPMQVGLRLSVALYTFFPLVSELAQEIASGVFMKQSQVRIMGANAASQQPEKTIVLIDLVPLGERFDKTTAFLTYSRFWHKEVAIKASFFGDYEVLYVRYPGLPSSPPTPSDISIIDDGPYSGKGNNGRAIKPLGVDIQKAQHKNGLTGGVIAIIALSASAALVLCSVVVWVLLFRRRNDDSQPMQTPQPLPPSVAKPPGTTVSMMGSGLSSASLSFGSSIAPYAGSAKTFSTNDIEKATNNFDNSRVLGEGGFGRVYRGILEDGTEFAVKVLKRDDQQGGREFLAEIEMLSRLHHRNLVKLIGICTEECARCLVYELVPNGSVESHLHGVDKESAPLDWDARIKIALGAARGLAYLHEDSSPRVIHRDFKASNILLEHDFTAKVSDFGLARTALDEESRHISTRVMGTFGYVAPEYAMTGHLLVKSDVYSYGVVLLELLSGRKPVDMSQPPGQENLVAWARPLLTSKEGLEMLIDPSLGPDVPFDSVAKVAAIASMCVQPEVSHRPFMGEVVQALKLVCNECDEAKEVGSSSSSQDFSINMDAGASAGSGHLAAPFQDQNLVANYDSEPDVERGQSQSEFFSTSARYARETSGSLRRCSSSGPLRTGRGRRLWERMRRMSGEGVSEHGIISRLWPGSR